MIQDRWCAICKAYAIRDDDLGVKTSFYMGALAMLTEVVKRSSSPKALLKEVTQELDTIKLKATELKETPLDPKST